MTQREATEDAGAAPGGESPRGEPPGRKEATRRANEVPDVVASAADPALHEIWSYEANARTERRLWLAVLRTQVTLGYQPPGGDAAMPAYERHRDGPIDTDAILAIEGRTRHDVKARIEYYNFQAGYEAIHAGMTSADVVDNVSLVKLRDSLVVLADLHDRPDLGMVASSIPFRGIKGAVGTQQDQIDLLGSELAAFQLDERVARHFGFSQVLGSVSQVYPRSIDLRVVAALAGECAREKHPLVPVLNGYLAMVAGYQGDTWNEGDVSQSVIRRVALPGAVFAADCILGGRLP